MEFVWLIVLAAITFGVCFLLDKGYTNMFRGKAQHKTGLAVRLNKRYALFGLIFALLGIVSVFAGIGETMVLLIGGIVVLLMGIGLIVYYMTFGVFYDADSFILSKFGSRSVTYSFGDIREQRLYMVQGGGIMIELYMADGRAVSLQSAMEGMYPFLDHAFTAWCRQTGRDPQDCPFHDPSQSLWFPSQEDA